MLVLGIESSCDESAVALVDVGLDTCPKILSEKVSSQVSLHAQYGGVVPELAAREHLFNLPLLYEAVLKEAQLSLADVDLIAVTQGPGLKGCLLIGLEFAKGLSLASGKPLIGVNHIEGHVQAARLEGAKLQEPLAALIVSGGHTEIIHSCAPLEYKVLARTIDDAAGEAFDKSANLLGFDYPGGAQLAKLADTVTISRFSLPKVMRESSGFSFSGLKTAIALLIKRQPDAVGDNILRAELAHSIQNSIVEALLFKLKNELESTPCKTITVSGGVACNRLLREQVSKLSNIPVLVPTPAHCVDNAAMIALAGGLRFLKQGQRAASSLDLEVHARWPIETLG